MITTVELPLPPQAQLCAEALRAFPRECCGLLEGTIQPLALSLISAKAGKGARVTALYPTRNVANEADRFEIDPAQHIALLRELRGTERAIIGCYHSHPNGRAEPSARDRESAAEDGFLWLIVAVDANTRTTDIAAFVSTGETFSVVQIADSPATAGVPPASPKVNWGGRDGRGPGSLA